ncbi:phosphate-starvation-inducible PsiE family protein [Lichenicola sp.]|uniref:phosphate-starvation-inducible PsiE family protein n=1 Tax=Lichenicola sp. TaxID=2804529 RepID=UPI003B003976
MDPDAHDGQTVKRIATVATRVFLNVETVAYIALGVLLALTTLIGMASAGGALWSALMARGDPNAIVATIDRLLFVLMLVEIMHTVRVSFRSGTLVCEPFLVVGLIASIRRVLVITLRSSQAAPASPAGGPPKLTPEAHDLITSSMLELLVLAALILVMVVSIVMLRWRRAPPGEPG